MCIVFHLRKEFLLIFLCVFVGIIREIYFHNVQVIKNLKILFHNLSKFCLIMCYFIEKKISKSKIQIKEKFDIKLMVLMFIFMLIFEIIAFKIEFTAKKYDIDEFKLLLQIISYFYIERIIFKNPIYSHHLLSIIICLLLLIFVLIEYSLYKRLLIILYALLGEYCYAFYFLLMKYINTTYFINIYLLVSISGILNICIQLPSFIKSSDVKIQSIYLFYILIMIIYYYFHFHVIKKLGPIHSTIIDIISYCIIKLYYHSLPYNNIINLFLCIISLLIYLEIIELNFCGLNENIKIEIEERGKIETNILLSNTTTYINSDSQF